MTFMMRLSRVCTSASAESCVLRPGGRILVVEFPRNSLAQKLWNENYYTGSELEDFLRKAGFESARARQIERKQILWVDGYRGTS